MTQCGQVMTTHETELLTQAYSEIDIRKQDSCPT